jgi:hypothetical protein
MATINPFMQPINYSTDVQSPFESALGGFKLGAGIAEVQAAQQKRELEIAALAQAQRRQTELADLFKNPNATSADYARVTAFLPKDQAKIVQDNFTAQTAEQQQQTLRQGAQVYTAIKSGNLDVAEMQLKEQAAALRNSGKEQQAQAYDDVSNLIRLNPTGAQATIGLLVAALPGGKDFLDNADKALGTIRTEAKAPAELKKAIADADKAVSDATTAQAQATNAPEKAAADAKRATADAEKARIESLYEEQKIKLGLRKTEEDIIINRENARIAALNAAAAKELNAVKRDEILQKREEATDKRDQAKRDQDSLLGNQLSSIDNFLNTAIRATNTPLDVRKAATGTISSRFIPTLRDATADYEGLIETLGAQAFLAQIPQIKGTGSLSENEGNKLQASLQNLSLKQSPERLQENINEAVRLLTKARANIAARSGKEVAPPDTPAATLKPPQSAIDLLKKDPSLSSQFEKKYGPNSASQYLKAN